MDNTTQAFLHHSRVYLRDHYLPKIERCLEQLTVEELWWRPNAVSNSIGNLILHLAGNIRQWIISGVGGEPDVRQRPREFDERSQMPASDLLVTLRTALDEVDTILADVDAAELLVPRLIQGREVTALEAIYHAVEHFSMHTGQILFITKMRTGSDLGFYHIGEDGTPHPRWQASTSNGPRT